MQSGHPQLGMHLGRDLDLVRFALDILRLSDAFLDLNVLRKSSPFQTWLSVPRAMADLLLYQNPVLLVLDLCL